MKDACSGLMQLFLGFILKGPAKSSKSEKIRILMLATIKGHQASQIQIRRFQRLPDIDGDGLIFF
jgi:hypothetical protein